MHAFLCVGVRVRSHMHVQVQTVTGGHRGWRREEKKIMAVPCRAICERLQGARGAGGGIDLNRAWKLEMIVFWLCFSRVSFCNLLNVNKSNLEDQINGCFLEFFCNIP